MTKAEGCFCGVPLIPQNLPAPAAVATTAAPHRAEFSSLLGCSSSPLLWETTGSCAQGTCQERSWATPTFNWILWWLPRPDLTPWHFHFPESCCQFYCEEVGRARPLLHESLLSIEQLLCLIIATAAGQADLLIAGMEARGTH